MPGGGKGAQRVRVEVKPLALSVGSVRAAPARPLVPVEPQPAQVADDGLRESVAGAGGIDVLHAQDERAAFLAAGQPRHEEGPRIAKVQKTCGARREPAPHGKPHVHPCLRETTKKTERTVRQQAVTTVASTCSPASSQPRKTPMTGLTYS